MRENKAQITQHEIILYQTDEANVSISVFFMDETFWLTQRAMAELFEQTAALTQDHGKTANWLLGETLRLMKERGMDAEELANQVNKNTKEFFKI